jgi:hypothetical protein
MKKLAYFLIVLSLALGLSQSKSFIKSGSAAPLWAFIAKTANPPHVYEPGGLVEFTVKITSGWPKTLTINSIIDNIHGNLNGQGTCSVPQTLLPGASYTCTFQAQVNGNAGYSETDTVTFIATDSDGNSFNGTASATVDVLDVPPVIAVTKTADPIQVNEPGGAVNFTVVVQNHSVVTDPVTITSLTDNIHGNLNGQGTCSVPQTIQPGASYTCTFPAQVNGNAGYSETDTVTASGTDDEGNPVSASDDATVKVVNVLPVIAVTKTANPTQVNEPGGPVTFTVVVQNNSGTTDPVTITSLTDNIHGNLNGQGTCSVPQTIQPGASYTCTFPAQVTGVVGYTETDTVTASGTDDEGNPVSASDDATVTVVNILPVIAVTKTANPTQVYEPGGPVTFTVVVQNNSGTFDPVTITSLTDDIHGNLNGQGTCSVPQTIQPGASYTCTFPAQVNGTAGHSETDTVTASGTDDEGTPVSASDDATVTVIANLYKLYFPIILNGINNNWDVTVGYEDLPFGSSLMDFDYNDFIVDIHSVLTYDKEIKNNLHSVNFVLTPGARGAVYDHEFHIAIAANVFKSDGVATLTLFDQNHNVIGAPQTIPFVGGSNTNFLIFSHTSDIFPEMSNTYETKPHLLPQRTAELNIQFNTPFAFSLADYQLTDEHGTGMFFDPFLKVLNTGEVIFFGDSRMLVIPDINYMWPEEHIRMDKAYPLTTFVPGPPPDVLFPSGWWLVHNTCVYGDGIPCPVQ